MNNHYMTLPAVAFKENDLPVICKHFFIDSIEYHSFRSKVIGYSMSETLEGMRYGAGTLVIEGEDYSKCQDKDWSTKFVYKFVAKKLELIP